MLEWASGKADFSGMAFEVRKAFGSGLLVSTEGLKDASPLGMGAHRFTACLLALWANLPEAAMASFRSGGDCRVIFFTQICFTFLSCYRWKAFSLSHEHTPSHLQQRGTPSHGLLSVVPETLAFCGFIAFYWCLGCIGLSFQKGSL